MPLRSCRRVLLAVLDGLRPDAIDAFELQHLLAIEQDGASTRSATTVSPSVTAAAMGSLLTGVSPEVHGLNSDRFHIPFSRGPVHPMPRTLRDAGLKTSAFLARPPFLFRRLVRRLADQLGVDAPHFVGQSATEILHEAQATLARQHSGLVVFHLPDADRAGHAHGWMSSSYGDAARRLDHVAGRLHALTVADHPDDTLLIICADHGGGGEVATDHESDHSLDRTIPILLFGAGIAPGTILDTATLLDIPPTVLAALGVDIPASYQGRVLTESFAESLIAA
jgi:predicted AlkP superfamily pyrophosphatase or phosphodiesterase